MPNANMSWNKSDFRWTADTKVTRRIFEASFQTDFYNLKNKAEGARRYGYAIEIHKYENPDGTTAFRSEFQTTLNGSRYQSSKYGSFVNTESEARTALDKTMVGASKRYAKLATQAGSGVEKR